MENINKNSAPTDFMQNMLKFYFDFQTTKGRFKMSSLSFHVMFWIYMSETGKLTVHELTEKLQICKPQLIKLLNNLEDENLVIRKRFKENRRIVYVSLSEDGSFHIEKTLEAMQSIFLENLTPDNDTSIDLLLQYMEKIAKAMHH